MPLYLCVDCGGSKTAAAISDASGNVAGVGSGGPSNITYLTVEGFISAVREAVGAALQQAITTLSLDKDISFPPVSDKQGPFVAAWFGISGADSPAAIAKVTSPLSTLLGIPVGPDLIIANDTHLLAAPVRMHSDVSRAIAVIGGTGSIAVSFKEEGGKIEELGRVGGWGWILGDEGGGFDVGRETLRQILMEQDKSSVTGIPLVRGKLVNGVLERFGVDNVLEFLGGVYCPDPSPSATIVPGEEKAFKNLPREKRISSLPPLVFEAAFEHSDPLALNILKSTAGHLASQIAILLGDGMPTSLRIVKASDSVISFGGSLVGIEAYRQLILDALAQRGHVFTRIAFIGDASASGATGLAATYNVASS